jgi:hypothetical protein
MSQLSAEVRAMAEAVNSGDLESFLARTADDVEFASLVAEAEGRTFRGHAGVRAWWGTVLGAFKIRVGRCSTCAGRATGPS